MPRMPVDNSGDGSTGGRAAEPAVRPRVEVMTRAGCHLCGPVLEVVARVCGESGVAWIERDVDSDPALRAHWSDLVPATLIDGAEHARWFLDEDAFRAALAAAAPTR